MKRRVHVLGTGGTIAGAQPDPGHYGYTAAQYGIDWLLNAVPGLDRLANLSGEQVVNIGSQDMDDGVWLRLARRVNEVLAAVDVDAADRTEHQVLVPVLDADGQVWPKGDERSLSAGLRRQGRR